MDAVRSFPFLATIISQAFMREPNISSLIKKAQQRKYFLQQKLNQLSSLMVYFCSSITIWYAAATAKDKGWLQRVISFGEKVIGCNLPSLQDLYACRTPSRARKIVADPSHPTYKLLESLPSGRRLRSIIVVHEEYKPHSTRMVSSYLQLENLTKLWSPPLCRVDDFYFFN